MFWKATERAQDWIARAAALRPDDQTTMYNCACLYARAGVRGEEAESRFDGNPWALWVCVPTGVINWDQFMYLPLLNYPRTGHGGWLEPVGDWRYVWE